MAINRVKELMDEYGVDIVPIIQGTSSERALKLFHRIPEFQSMVIPEWTEDDIARFSEYVYSLYKRFDRDKLS